ncbi:proton-conducting transporter membrane subunit [Rhodopseudomonas palustris]|uniref:complex I subunit 5 family protein n=1 Tax=Rhodopseudomonas palustris TaxID=1076 RepID=UPI002ACD22A1|nr:proton-conducting transporter membrane subunit [Rhodopseudomonas palustris]WQG99785.1 proton-conducting transporter membrane subunit [Rhodopseudomonas palustris]
MPAIFADLVAPAVPWAAISVVLPLAAALIAALLGRHAHRLAIPTALAGLAVAALATTQVARHGVIEIAVGGWKPPLGIALRLDGLGCAFLLVIALVSAGVMLFARAGFGAAPDGSETRRGYVFWPLLFCTIGGLAAIAVSGDLFNLYVGLELLTVTAVALVGLDGKPAALAAAIRYLLFALLGSLLYLLGTAILYLVHGTLDIRLLAGAASTDGATLTAVALMTAGLMAKAALFPLHGWLPPAHASAPAPASALLSALVVKGPFIIMLRLWFEIAPAIATPFVAQGLGALGAAGILIGSLLALRQHRLKLVIAYSTVAQLGYLLLVFPLAGGSGEQQPWTAGAWTGIIFHAMSHALAKSAMFLAAGAMVEAIGDDQIERLDGIGQHLPIATFAFGLAAVSLMGLPPSGGFTGKYLLLSAAFASGQWWWAVVMIGGGLLAAGYLFRPLSHLLAERHQPGDLVVVARSRQTIALGLAALSILLGLLSLGPYQLLQIGRPGAAAEGLS